jgi:hemerythrin-like domain-containing protein
VLLSVGGVAVAGGAFAGGFAAGDAAAPRPATAAAEQALRVPTPGEDLMTEHGLLIRILLIYRNLMAAQAAGQPVDAGHAHATALIVHDYVEAFHEALEEAYVFPRLQRAGRLDGTISTLLLQHARGRQQTQLILADTAASGALRAPAAGRVSDAMAEFVRMYEPHEAREDTVVYPEFRSLLTPVEIGDLGVHFADLQQEQFGRDGFAVMLGRVAAVEQALGIYDLGQFTPANITPPATAGTG